VQLCQFQVEGIKRSYTSGGKNLSLGIEDLRKDPQEPHKIIAEDPGMFAHGHSSVGDGPVVGEPLGKLEELVNHSVPCAGHLHGISPLEVGEVVQEHGNELPKIVLKLESAFFGAENCAKLVVRKDRKFEHGLTVGVLPDPIDAALTRVATKSSESADSSVRLQLMLTQDVLGRDGRDGFPVAHQNHRHIRQGRLSLIDVNFVWVARQARPVYGPDLIHPS